MDPSGMILLRFVVLLEVVRISSSQSYIELNNTGCVQIPVNIVLPSSLTTIDIANKENVVLCLIYIQRGVVVSSVISKDYTNKVSCTSSNTESTLCFLVGVTDTDAGVYTTDVNNVKRSSTLYVIKKPTTAAINASGDAVESLLLNLTCSSSSTSLPSGFPFTYTWTVDNGPVSDPRYLPIGPGNANLNIDTLQKQDDGKQIRCTGTEEHGISSSESSAYIIDVKYPPVIETLTNRQLVEGSELSVLCDVTPGNPKDNTIYWTWSGDPAYKHNGSTLHFQNLQRTNSGIYTCTAENTYPSGSKGTATMSMSVSVLYPPVIATLTDSHPVEGYELSILCDVTPGNPKDNIIYWTWSVDPSFKLYGNTLHFQNIQRTNSGTYTCTAENTYSSGSKGTASKSMSVNVLYPPLIETLTNRQPVEGSDLSVLCDVTSGNPTNNTIYWTRSDDPGFQQNGNTLHFQNIQRTNKGTYTCTAENTYPSGSKGTATMSMLVNVLYPPEIKDGSPVTEIEGTKITLYRAIDSNPLSTSSWYRDKKLLETVPSSQNTSYTIQSAQCTDTGNYTIIASNGIKENDTAYVQLFIKCKPMSISNGGKKNITLGITDDVGIDFNGTFIAYPEPEFKLTYLNNTMTTKFTTSKVKNSVNNFMFIFNKSKVDQADYTQYNLEVVNEIGKILIYIDVIPQRKPSAPVLKNVTCNESSSAVIKWTPSFNGGDDQLFDITVFTKNGDVYSHVENISDEGENKDHSYKVDGLQSSTFYSFNLSATNTHGTTYSGAAYSCTTEVQSNIQPNSNSAMIAGAAGSAAGLVVAVIVIAVIIFYMKRRSLAEKQLEKDISTSQLNKDYDKSNSEDGLKENALYVSAGPKDDETPGASGVGDVYSQVKKMPQKNENNNVYAEVDKSKVKGKMEGPVYADVVKPKKGVKKDKGKKGKKEKKKQQNDVYENSEDIALKQTKEQNKPRERGYKNQDGLLYVDVQFDSKPNDQKPVIHGEEDKTDYATVSFEFPQQLDHDREDKPKET